MKKLAFLAGLGVGFILGSRTGTGPYDSLEGKVRSLRERPDVAETVDRAKAAASEQVTGVVDKVNEKLPTSNGVTV
jgi:hypothetical protein